MAFSLKFLFGSPDAERGVHRLYGEIVGHARSEALYRRFGVPDTPTGRYAMVALHAFLVMDRLGRATGQGELSQTLFDVMFTDLDRNLREMGVGDLSVGKRVKELARHFYAMAAACRDGLNRDDAVLCAALSAHAFGHEMPSPASAAAMAAYVRACVSALEGQDLDEIAQGGVRFPDPQEGPDS